MDSDQGKLFIGGVSWETTEEKLKDHFGNYGEVLQAVVMRDRITSNPRGFAFVVFADPSVLDRVLLDQHTIDGRTVEAKKAMSREEQQTSVRTGNSNAGRGSGGGGNNRTKKIFVGGLPPTLSEEEFRQYFQNYGNVTDVVVMYDQNTQRPRGFGFISFDDEDAVERTLHKTFHELNGKNVEVKRALPKDANTNSGSGGGRSGGGGSYQSYGTVAGANSQNSYDANRYMQSQTTAGSYPSYGSSGYGTPAYGYGSGNNGAGFGGYGVGGYGGPAGPYGNPTASAGGYGPPSAQRSPWTSQAPTGYVSSGYGGAPAAGSMGQSLNTATGGYGNQGYGYGGGYGGGDGYGAVGGRGSSAPAAEQGATSGYMGGGGVSGGYGDANGNSGYSSAWKSDPSQGGYGAGYGGQAGYGGGQAAYGGGYGAPQGHHQE